MTAANLVIDLIVAFLERRLAVGLGALTGKLAIERGGGRYYLFAAIGAVFSLKRAESHPIM